MTFNELVIGIPTGLFVLSIIVIAIKSHLETILERDRVSESDRSPASHHGG